MQDVERKFATGVQLLQSGQPKKALPVFKAILKAFPRHPDTLFYTAVAQLQLGKPKQALQNIQQARKADPDNGHIANVLGLCLNALGQPDQAITAFEQAVSKAPDILEPHYNLGITLQAVGRHADATRALEAGLRLAPRNRDVRVRLAGLYSQAGLFDSAAEVVRPVFADNPDDVRAFEELTRALLSKNALEELSAVCEAQLSEGRTAAWAHHRLMQVYLRQGDSTQALQHGAKAVALQPRSAHIRHGFAWALDVVGDHDTATQEFDAVLELQPDHKQALMREASRQFLEEDRWNGALWAVRMDGEAGISPVKAPDWDGSDLGDGSLIVLGEQGVGDQILFAGQLKHAVGAAASVTVECEERLIPLFSRSFQGLDFVPRTRPPSRAVSDAPFARKIAMADLIGLSRPTPQAAYLAADRSQTKRLSARYGRATGRFLVGVSWQSANKENGPFRTVPLALWQPILQTPECVFVNLQYGDQETALRTAEKATGVRILDDPEVDSLKDLDSFAGQVAAMDAVVTADNTTVHMAGALGVATLLMLPVDPDWRWQRSGKDTLWYQSVTLIRQESFGNWDDVVARAAAQLAEWSRQTA